MHEGIHGVLYRTRALKNIPAFIANFTKIWEVVQPSFGYFYKGIEY